jgi:dihydropyrimidinase
VELDTAIVGGTLVTPTETYSADIGIKGSKIAVLGTPGSLAADRKIDASGLFVMPCLVDPHTHLDLPWVMGDGDGPEVRSADNYESGTRAAAAGGVTTILDFAMSRPGSQLTDAVDEWKSRATAAIVDFGLHVIMTDWSHEVMEGLPDVASRGVSSVKVFMPYAIGAPEPSILDTLSAVQEMGGVTLIHCEAACAITWLVNRETGRPSTTTAHYRTRPDIVEADAVARAGRLAEIAEAGYYNVHMSSAAALEELRRSRSRGVEALGETCPHYLTLDESLMDLPDGQGDKYTCTPPLRTAADRSALWRGLRDGSLATVGSDHAPWRFDVHKSMGRHDFTKLPHGLPTLQTMLPVLYTFGYMGGQISLNRLVEVTSANPARIFGLSAKGALAPGFDADIVLIDPRVSKRVDFRSLEHRMDYSPWDGQELHGWPATTLSRGRVVFDGTGVVAVGGGQFVGRSVRSRP